MTSKYGLSRDCCNKPFLILSYIALLTGSPSAMSSTQQSDLEAAIVDACTTHEAAHRREDDYRRACVVSVDTKSFVKWGNSGTLLPEIETQLYISEYAQSLVDTSRMPRIPKVIHHFGDQRTMYMVMDIYHSHLPSSSRPSREDSRGPQMALGGFSSSWPCAWSLRVRSHPPSLLQGLQSTSSFFEHQCPRTLHRECALLVDLQGAQEASGICPSKR